jgi:hypothetical protein
MILVLRRCINVCHRVADFWLYWQQLVTIGLATATDAIFRSRINTGHLSSEFESEGRTVSNPKRSIMETISKILVPGIGVEPTRPCGHRILSPARLPVPPARPRVKDSTSVASSNLASPTAHTLRFGRRTIRGRDGQVVSGELLFRPPQGMQHCYKVLQGVRWARRSFR